MKARIIILIFLSCSLYAMDNKKDPHYQAYKQRFPQTRKSYKKYSNDHELFLEHLEQEIINFKKRAPNVFNTEVNIFTLGCHDGDTSKSVVEIMRKHGVQNISFRGIDPYKEHVDETSDKLGNFRFREVFVEQDDLEKYKLREKDKNSAHIILVEQVCHHIDNIEQFIKKVTQLAAQQSIVVFGHTDDSASALNQLFNKIIGGSKYINTNVCPKIKSVLKKDGHTFTKKAAKQKIKLPNISSQTWKFLNSIKGSDYSNNYNSSSETDLEVKNVIEFCATQPLEKLATSWIRKKFFLSALSTKFGKTIDLEYKIHTIHFDKK